MDDKDISTKVYLSSNEIETGLYKVDVNIQNIPEDLFGISFHLVTTGVGWSLERYEQGTVFDTENPLVFVKEKDSELVVGMSLRRGEYVDVQDGTVLSFYMNVSNPGEINMMFDHSVLSVFDNGRRDVEGVNWEGKLMNMDFGSTSDNSEKGEEKEVDFSHDQSDFEADVFTTMENPNYKSDIINSNADSSFHNYYLFMAISLLVFAAIFLLYFLLEKKRKSM